MIHQRTQEIKIQMPEPQFSPSIQSKELASIPASPPPPKHNNNHSSTDGLLVDNKSLSLAVSGSALQDIQESEAKDFFVIV